MRRKKITAMKNIIILNAAKCDEIEKNAQEKYAARLGNGTVLHSFDIGSYR